MTRSSILIIIFGVLATATALITGIAYMLNGKTNPSTSNKLMQLRVWLQAAVVIFIFISLFNAT